MNTVVKTSPGTVGNDGMSTEEIDAVLRIIGPRGCERLAIAYRNGSATPHRAYPGIARVGDELNFILFADGGRIFRDEDGAGWQYRNGKGTLFSLHSIAAG